MITLRSMIFAVVLAAVAGAPRAMAQVGPCPFGPHLIPYHRPVSKAECPADVDVVASLKPVPAPLYPRLLRGDVVEAHVRVQFIVNEHGRVDTNTINELSSTHSLFTSAVRQAMVRWIGKPARLNDVAVPQWMTLEIDFSSACTMKRSVAAVKSGDTLTVCA